MEKIVPWSDECWSWYADPSEGIEILEGLIKSILTNTNSDTAVIALSDYDHPNWRNDVMPTYKLARKQKHHTSRPIVWKALRDYIQLTMWYAKWDGLEGDDVLGVLATDPLFAPELEKIVCSIDKDLQTIPGNLVNFREEVSFFGFEIREISEAYADYYHMLQTLTGDSTDGYPGCPGVGPVTAKRILDQFTVDLMRGGEVHGDVFKGAEAWNAIVKEYAKKGLTEDDALQNARVARICRATDIDHKTRTVKLWEPPR